MGQATIGYYDNWALEQKINKERKRMIKKAMGFRKKHVTDLPRKAGMIV